MYRLDITTWFAIWCNYSFYGQSLTQESVNLTRPLIRTFGRNNNIHCHNVLFIYSLNVYFIVNGATPSMDVCPSNGSVKEMYLLTSI